MAHDYFGDRNFVGKPCIIKARDTVFVGILESRKGGEASIKTARRVLHYEGASSLSELAVRGTSNPEACKLPIAVPFILVIGVTEILPLTEEARVSIEKIPEWTG